MSFGRRLFCGWCIAILLAGSADGAARKSKPIALAEAAFGVSQGQTWGTVSRGKACDRDTKPLNWDASAGEAALARFPALFADTLAKGAPLRARPKLRIEATVGEVNARLCEAGRRQVTGALTGKSGVTCLTAVATVTGLVTVRGGASLRATGATLKAAVTATGTGALSLLHTTVTGPVTATGSGPVALEASSVRGPVTLLNGRSGTVVAGNVVNGPLTCAANQPPPVNNGLRNTGTGPRLGQCAHL